MDVFRDYSLPLLLAVGIHAAAVLALAQEWKPPPNEPQAIRPDIVNAALLVLERPKPKPAPRPAPPPPSPKPEPKPEPRVAEVPTPKDPLAEQRRREEEAERERLREEQARKERLEALAESAFEQALEQEAMEIGSDGLDDASMSYVDGIYRAVVANWSRPPSARNDMETQLRVELIPTGEVVSVTVISSSGNSAFDRSAEAAVRKARRFEVPSEIRLFERHFRSFVLLFKPQDLLL
ncbi:MAG: cell envelope integrity protein TolA [Gammaproteobacteria bacterium]|nr:cell envelope integrity protein TolA [Gammaproteobacteria bacterium]MDE0225331.1 cell envelope integrity protein TolA [Gammaproteobacteria bacterium]MDE0450170.1 cell envelope integrity protein TolA [Gammaproteobacteria bacterium]